MAKIINSTYITLEGSIAEPQHWPSLGSTHSDEGGAIQTDLLLGCDTLIMGRATYEVFSSVWPERTGDPYSDHINSMQKFVVSTTMDSPEWNNTELIDDDVVGRLRRLKDDAAGDIVQYGFGRLSTTLMDHDLLDELHLWVHPFFVGASDGDDLIKRPAAPHVLDLADVRRLGSGIVILTYRRATAGG